MAKVQDGAAAPVRDENALAERLRGSFGRIGAVLGTKLGESETAQDKETEKRIVEAIRRAQGAVKPVVGDVADFGGFLREEEAANILKRAWRAKRGAKSMANLKEEVDETMAEVTREKSRVASIDGQIWLSLWVRRYLWWLTPIFYIIHLAVKRGVFFTLAPAVLFSSGTLRENLILLMATHSTGVVVASIKWAWRSPRPIWILGEKMPILYGVSEWTYATPSGHSAILTTIYVMALWNQGILPLIFGSFFLWLLTAASRLYWGVHWTQDVTVGGVIGAVIGVCFAAFPILSGDDDKDVITLAIVIGVFFVTLLLSGAVPNYLVPPPDKELMSYWQRKVHLGKPITPHFINKSYYAMAFVGGVLFGAMLRVWTFPSLLSNLAAKEPLENHLPPFFFLLAIPINRYLVETADKIKHYFARSQHRALARDNLSLTPYTLYHPAVVRQRNIGYLVESSLYFFIALFTTYLFPLFIHSQVSC